MSFKEIIFITYQTASIKKMQFIFPNHAKNITINFVSVSYIKMGFDYSEAYGLISQKMLTNLFFLPQNGILSTFFIII